MRRVRSAVACTGKAGVVALVLLGSGCASPPPIVSGLSEPTAYHLLPPDEMMSCAAIEESFRYAAARAARLEFGLASDTSGTFQTGHFQDDAPQQIEQEEERLDALVDLARDRGCPVFEPRRAVAAELARLMSPPYPSCARGPRRCVAQAPGGSSRRR